jgi:tetratricopeptide (TPR) repeat protein
MNSRILDEEQNRATLTELLHDAASSGVTPFVGAGLSVPWKLPTWWKFLIDAAPDKDVRDAARAAMLAHDYERAAELVDDGRRRASAPPVQEAVRATFGGRPDAGKHVRAPVQLLPRLADGGPVITTNFDRLLEEVFARHGRPLFPVWGVRAHLLQESTASKAPILVKLHGDACHPAEQILTKSAYDAHYGTSDSEAKYDPSLPLPALLTRIFLLRPVLFLGCSLTNDRTMSVLRRAISRSDIRHYAVVSRKRDPHLQKEWAHFLMGKGIRPIWYLADQHSAIGPFLYRLTSARKHPAAAHSSEPAAGSRGPGSWETEWSSLKRARQRARAAIKAIDRTKDCERAWEFYWRDRELIDRVLPHEAPAMHRRVAEGWMKTAPDRAALALLAEGAVLRQLGDGQGADRALREAAAIAPREMPSPASSATYHSLAKSLYRAGNLVEAERRSRVALRHARLASASRSDFRSSWLDRGLILQALGRHRAGRRYVARALCDARRTPRDGDAARILSMLIRDYSERGQLWRAVRLARCALQLAQSHHYSLKAVLVGNMAAAMQDLGDELSRNGKREEAIAYMKEARDAHWLAWFYEFVGRRNPREVLTHVRNVAWLEWRLAEAAADEDRRNHLNWSIDFYTQALQQAEADRLSLVWAHTLIERALPLAAFGAPQEALADIRSVLPLLKRRNDTFFGTALNNRGLIWQRCGAFQRARRAYEAALATASQDGLRETILWNLRSLTTEQADAC